MTYNPFTGVHGAFIVDSDLNILPMTPGNSSDLLARGTVIVLSTSALIVPSGQPYTNQPTHYAMPCSSSYDKRVFGVYFSDCIQREPYVNQGSIAALGDGIILVCDEGGDLEVGDYITTSNTVGHGMKQDDDLLHNYTVAKSLRDVIWADEDTTTLLIPCTYHAG